MKNYTDSELRKELISRGYEIFDPKEIAMDSLWTLDDAIDTYNQVKKDYHTHNELTHSELMGILNEMISSAHVMQMISEELYRNIYENLFED